MTDNPRGPKRDRTSSGRPPRSRDSRSGSKSRSGSIDKQGKSRTSSQRKPERDRSVGRGSSEANGVPERDRSKDLPWPEEIFELELEPELAAELEAFGGRTDTLTKHLLSIQVLAEEDPEAAYQHACRVRDRIPRAALGRQTACIAAYRTGRYKEAIKEEAAYRRISGNLDLVPMAADCERGAGRPERALSMISSFDASTMDEATATESLIVAAGARQDLSDTDAARVLLQKAVGAAKSPMSTARARFALGKFLADSGDEVQARKWLESAIEIDDGSGWTEAHEVLETL